MLEIDRPSLAKENDLQVLVVDSGGRGHALVQVLAASSRITRVLSSIAAAGQMDGKIVYYPYDKNDPTGQAVEIAKTGNVDLVIFGAEGPLSHGAVDRLTEIGIPAVGPESGHTWLESDKALAKEFMKRWRIPIPHFSVFTDFEEATAYIKQEKGKLLVVKAAYLAQGKGSIVCSDQNDAITALRKLMVEKVFNSAGEKVVVEDRLFGIEQSVTVLTDGRDVIMLPTARDYKQRYDGNIGLNTGGMGSHSPSGNEDIFDREKVLRRIVMPALEGIHEETGRPYQGILYPGLMWVKESGEWNPYVLEFNIRAGDPEAQVLFPRLAYPDWGEIMLRLINGELGDLEPEWSGDEYLTVCLVSGAVPKEAAKGKGNYPGYPGRYKTGQQITGKLDSGDGSYVLHSGTVWCCIHAAVETHRTACGQGYYESSGGRVLSVVGHGPDLPTARDNAYSRAAQIIFNYGDYRNDIGDPELLRAERSNQAK